MITGLSTNIGRPFSTSNPADACCNSDLAQYSHTPILHHSAWPDSRTRPTTRTRTKRFVVPSEPLIIRSTQQKRRAAAGYHSAYGKREQDGSESPKNSLVH